MDIQILHKLEGAKQARGLTVIIDVFRAFSVACYVTANGAKEIIPVGNLEQAYQLKQTNPQYVLIGERNGRIQPGFDYGNSPSQVIDVDFRGKTVIHTTSAGTQGIANAVNADEIITGSFVNAGAIAAYIRARSPQAVSLVCMGWNASEPADEDTLCAEYIRNELTGQANHYSEVVRFLKEESRTVNFLGLREEASASGQDFDYCLDLDRFSFVLKAETNPHSGRLRLSEISVKSAIKEGVGNEK